MPDGTIDLTALLVEVTRAKTVADSVEAFILTTVPARIKTEVTAALLADANADQATIDAVNLAIDGAVQGLAAEHDRIATAIMTGTGTPPAPPA